MVRTSIHWRRNPGLEVPRVVLSAIASSPILAHGTPANAHHVVLASGQLFQLCVSERVPAMTCRPYCGRVNCRMTGEFDRKFPILHQHRFDLVLGEQQQDIWVVRIARSCLVLGKCPSDHLVQQVPELKL